MDFQKTQLESSDESDEQGKGDGQSDSGENSPEETDGLMPVYGKQVVCNLNDNESYDIEILTPE